LTPLFGKLSLGSVGWDHDRPDVMLTLRGDDEDVYVLICLGHRGATHCGRLMVNLNNDECWGRGDDNGTIMIADAEYPAWQFVPAEVALRACKVFFETGERAAELPRVVSHE
jgi:hypothetical protein